MVSLVSPHSDAAVEVKSSTLTSLTSLLCVVSSPADQKITAEPGEDVTLTCRAESGKDIKDLDWTRTDLGDKNVYQVTDNTTDLEGQHPSFKNRVDLQDRQMKDGDVSLILKNVTTADGGTYEARVIQNGTNHMKNDIEPICTIILAVSPSGECVFVCGSEVKQLPGC